MNECISGMLYMVGRYFALLGSMAFAGTTVLCYLLGVCIILKVVSKLFSMISREENVTYSMVSRKGKK